LGFGVFGFWFLVFGFWFLVLVLVLVWGDWSDAFAGKPAPTGVRSERKSPKGAGLLAKASEQSLQNPTDFPAA
jgi:hypothetical protein